ncbi:MAG: FeoA family protein [bacterium]|nr:FeoA family protein [bacterium]
MTVRDGKIGQSYTVTGMDLAKETEFRLQALGLTIGTKIIILNNKRSGAVIFKVRGTRLAIGKEFAEAISITGEA